MKMNIKKKRFFLSNLPWFAARRAFFACLIIFFISLLIGVIILCKNYFNIEAKKNDMVEQKGYFDEKAHEQLLKFWQENEKKFNEANSDLYPDPFVLTP